MASQSIVGGEDYRARVLRDGAVGYWRLGEASGPTAVDAVAAPANGTYIGGVTLGQSGALADGNLAPVFDGTSGYVAMGNVAALRPTAAVSFEVWLNTSDKTKAIQYIGGCGTTGSAGYTLATDVASVAWRGGNGVSLGFLLYGTVALVNGVWLHVVGTYDATGPKLYCNGVQAQSIVSNTIAGAAIGYGATTDFRIAQFAALNAARYWVGKIDEVAIYPTALSAQTIAAHYGLRLATLGGTGVRVGGAAPVQRRRVVVATGGVRVSGAPVMHRRRVAVGQGGVRVSGAAPMHRRVTARGTGGVRVSGGAALSRGVAVIGQGGVRLGGTALVRRTLTVFGRGGLVIGGIAILRRARAIVGTGGLRIGGTAGTRSEIFALDSSGIDAALVAALLADGPLLALMPDGVWMDEAPPGCTRFVIVSLLEAHDEPQFGGRAYEDDLFLVKAVALSTAAGNVRAAAKRIDAILDERALTIPGYRLMALRRVSRLRLTEVDDQDSSIRWQHRGGHYQLMAAPQ